MKIKKTTNVYFDTNLLNKLAYVRNYNHVFEVMKKYSQVVCISELTIFEILRDQKDLNNIENIIIMLQSANSKCGIKVLPSISQVFISYLFGKKIVRSESKVIIDVIKNPKKTFIYDDNVRDYLRSDFKDIQTGFKSIVKSIKDMQSGCANIDLLDYKIIFFAQLLFNLFLKSELSPFKSKSYNKFQNTYLRTGNDIDNFFDAKCDLATSNESPFYIASFSMLSQSKKVNNGIFMDGLHSCYYHYVDCFVQYTLCFQTGID